MAPASSPERSEVGLGAPVVRLVVAGLLVEALVLLAVAGLYLVETLVGAATSLGLGLGGSLLALALAALLGGSAVGMARGRRRGRAPALVWQLLQTFVAVQVVRVETSGSLTWWAALAVAGLGGLLAVALLTGATGRALPHGPDPQDRLL